MLDTETNGTTFATSAEDTHVPALDDASTDTSTPVVDTTTPAVAPGDTAATEDAEAPVTTETEPAAAPVVEGVDELIQKFATEAGLDLNNPREKAIAKRLADKELFIRKQNADMAALRIANKPATTDEGLTEFEKSLRPAKETTPPAPAPVAAPKPGEPAAPAPNAHPEDAGSKWTKPEDYLMDLNSAWQANDLPKVHAIETAAWSRRFQSIAGPQIEAYVNQRVAALIQEQLGDVVPHVRQTVEQAQRTDSVDFAIQQLSKTAGFEDIGDLNKEVDGPPIKFNGEEFRNTPMNKAIAENPWLLQIRVNHADPNTASRLTNLARFRAAHKIVAGGKVPDIKAKQLMDAGKVAADKAQQDRTRQSLNGGPGAGTSLTPGKGKTGGYVADELLSTDGESTSFASM